MFLSKLSMKKGRLYVACRCDECYSFFSRRAEYKSKKHCGSCGYHLSGKSRTTHGKSKKNDRLYGTWANMKSRCLNPNSDRYHMYGGAGISICDEWLDFMSFYAWAMTNGYGKNLTIDRKDSSGNYEPSNCRFVDVSTQNANKRITNKNKSGYIGVHLNTSSRFVSCVQWRKKRVFERSFKDPLSAAYSRDQFIVDNHLPHTLNFTLEELENHKAKERKEGSDLISEMHS